MMIHKSILITRPEPLATELADAIRQAGGNPVVFPVLEIVDPLDPNALLETLNRLDVFDWAIFISPTAVLKTFERLKQAWPKNLKVAAIGQGTAQKLSSFGIQSVVVPSEFNSESLLSLPAFQNMGGSKIVLFRGEGGRELLAEVLQDRGALVTHAIAYRRQCPESNGQALWAEWQRMGIGVIVVTSQEALMNLVALVGKPGMDWLHQQCLIVTSPNIQAKAIRIGFHVIRLAKNASNQEIMHALVG